MQSDKVWDVSGVVMLLVVVAVALMGWLHVGHKASAVRPVAQVQSVHVEEDEPGWDCHTMGNKVCGL